jgi:hypothetical protein
MFYFCVGTDTGTDVCAGCGLVCGAEAGFGADPVTVAGCAGGATRLAAGFVNFSVSVFTIRWINRKSRLPAEIQ